MNHKQLVAATRKVQDEILHIAETMELDLDSPVLRDNSPEPTLRDLIHTTYTSLYEELKSVLAEANEIIAGERA